MCSKLLYRMSNTITHYRKQHDLHINGNGQCERCGFEVITSSANDLINHNNRCVTGNSVQCPRCFKSLNLLNLKSHYLFHHINECPLCSSKFRSFRDVDIHFSQVHQSGAAGEGELSDIIQIGGLPQEPMHISSDEEETLVTEVPNSRINIQNAQWDIRETRPTEQEEGTRYGIIDFKLTCFPIDPPHLENHAELVSHFKIMISSLLNSIIKAVPEDGVMRLVIEGANIDHPIVLPMTSPSDYTPEMVFNEVESILNSNETFALHRKLKIHLLAVRRPAGSGRPSIDHYKTVEEFLKAKRAIIACKNSDNLCLGRAIIIADLYGKSTDMKRRLKKLGIFFRMPMNE